VLLQLGSAQRRASAIEAASTAYEAVVGQYPASSEARTALDALSEMGAAGRIDGFQRGLVLYYADQLREAIASFSAYLASGPSASRAAAAQYFAARAQAETGDRGGAAAQLTAMAQMYPASSYAPDALLRAARLTEGSGNRLQGIAAYLLVADTFPASKEAAQALQRSAWLLLRGGNETGARESWRRLAQHPDPEARAQGLFWLGRSLLRAGDAAAAHSMLAQATEAAPWSYEGLRAREIAAVGTGAEPFIRSSARLTLSTEDDAAACTAWIDTWAPSDNTGSAAADLARIGRLLLVGMRGPAQSEALDAIAAAGGRPHDLDDLGRGLADRGLYPLAIYAARQLAAASPAGTLDGAPACVQRVAYPLAFADLVEQEAAAYGLDPYLMLALLRQESWFSTGAHSAADARGLGQVIPSTARDIARALGRRDFTDDDLYRPDESIAFCAWYLNQQLEDLQRRPLLALAAYNAGPGNARRWAAGNLRIDADEYVEGIDFAETRNYVRAIYQHYVHYRELYGPFPP
jgi:soluble lytic murein transglycosylase